MTNTDEIVALATPSGAGAIAIIRISGQNAIAIGNRVFQSVKNKTLENQKTHTLHLGNIVDKNKIIDQVLVSIFRAPNSYTGENTIEISCHGSTYIQQKIIQLLLNNGCRTATPGEFTLRAFLNGKLDLSQAEAVADLISSDNEASHQIAMQQMRGGFSTEIAQLRQELLNFASLIELELDFSEEDVAFADRVAFEQLIDRIDFVLKRLIESFSIGNVIKNGIPIAIVGPPNVGKSTLLNALLNEDRAIVSAIAGTTRDTIEDEIVIGGLNFRFIDTAGIRKTNDEIENIGIQKTFQKMNQAQLVLYMIDGQTLDNEHKIEQTRIEIEQIKNQYSTKKTIVIINKTETFSVQKTTKINAKLGDFVSISAKENIGIEALKKQLLKTINTENLSNNQTIITNVRHYDSLQNALCAIQKVNEGIKSELPSDLLSIEIREALYHFGLITGEVTNDELLGNIFANFCIGK